MIMSPFSLSLVEKGLGELGFNWDIQRFYIFMVLDFSFLSPINPSFLIIFCLLTHLVLSNNFLIKYYRVDWIRNWCRLNHFCFLYSFLLQSTLNPGKHTVIFDRMKGTLRHTDEGCGVSFLSFKKHISSMHMQRFLGFLLGHQRPVKDPNDASRANSSRYKETWFYLQNHGARLPRKDKLPRKHYSSLGQWPPSHSFALENGWYFAKSNRVHDYRGEPKTFI